LLSCRLIQICIDMAFKNRIYPVLFLATFFFFSFRLNAQNKHVLEGRWDLELEFEGKTEPSWLEIRHSGHETFIGRFVFAFGSARPIAEVHIHDNTFNFEIPRQWEDKGGNMVFIGKLKEDKISGILKFTDGRMLEWSGVRAPRLAYSNTVAWGKTINLFNKSNLDGWEADAENQWMVKDGLLISPKSGANLISTQKFTDFKLHAEFKYPKGSNSGIYLRGRYEVQIADNKGLEPSDIYFGGIYGFLEPNENAAKNHGEWQTYDITLIGNRVTVVANGKTIISDRTIPGITGGAIDSKEGTPGAFMLQGDHGPITFRKFEVTPSKN